MFFPFTFLGGATASSSSLLRVRSITSLPISFPLLEPSLALVFSPELSTRLRFRSPSASRCSTASLFTDASSFVPGIAEAAGADGTCEATADAAASGAAGESESVAVSGDCDFALVRVCSVSVDTGALDDDEAEEDAFAVGPELAVDNFWLREGNGKST